MYRNAMEDYSEGIGLRGAKDTSRRVTIEDYSCKYVFESKTFISDFTFKTYIKIAFRIIQKVTTLSSFLSYIKYDWTLEGAK